MREGKKKVRSIENGQGRSNISLKKEKQNTGTKQILKTIIQENFLEIKKRLEAMFWKEHPMF